MSTSYFRLKPFVQELVKVQAELGIPGKYLLPFASKEPDDKCPMRSYWGGSERGSVVYANENLPDDTLLISSYGELLTVAQVKARNGARRQDSMPTELFGYEE